MTKNELIIEKLNKLGLRPEIDEDGDIMVRYQMKRFFVIVGDEEDNYLSVLFPQFYEIEDGEQTLILATCNKLTRELKLAKVFVDHTFKSVSATCEFFYANEESLEQNISNSFQMLGLVRSTFRNAKSELSE